MISSEKRGIARRLPIKLTALLMVLIGTVMLILTLITPNITAICEYNTKVITLRLINNAINKGIERLGTDGADYSRLVRLTYSENGHVSAIECNTTLINTVKTYILNDINTRLLNGDIEPAHITVGTLSGFSAFDGLGAEVVMTLKPEGYADAVFISEFSDAGINQTLHRIVMRTTVNVTAIIPFYTVKTQITEDFILAETIVVGDIPESYTHIISGDKDIMEDYNNYA